MGDHDMPQHHYTLATRSETPREAGQDRKPHVWRDYWLPGVLAGICLGVLLMEWISHA